MSVSHRPARKDIEAYELPDGRTIYILAQGRLVNLAAGDGHPAEIMDMSFAIQALSARYIATNHPLGRVPGDMVIQVPEAIDDEVARRKLATLGVSIDCLTEEQHRYIYGE
jgi:adenosylhomocysteinase